MKEIGENTRLQPNQRQANIEKFLVQLKGNPEAVQIWSSWYDMIFIKGSPKKRSDSDLGIL